MSNLLFSWADQVRRNNAIYGIRWSTDVNSDPNGLRLGNLQLHRTLPIQSLMKRCVLTDAGTVNYYLHPTDSTLKADGTAADLTGADGQWVVEIPAHWYKETQNSLFHTQYFSLIQQSGSGWMFIPRHYVSAGEAALQRSTSKLACVINATADYRGGNNTAAWDAAGHTLLAKPATNFTRTQGRTFAANRGAGWIMENPVVYNAWRRLLFCEYATRNVQLNFTATPTAQGYKQGGLGPGVTNANGTEWSNYNGYNPFINIGVTTSLGNASGVIDVSVANFGGAGIARTHQVNSYRGIENPWGHIWKWLDGYNIWAQTVAEGSKTLLYARNQTTGLADNTSSGYYLVGELSRTETWVRTMLPLHLFPSVTGGAGSGSTTYWCDYFYTNATSSFGWRAPCVGGLAYYGSTAGPVFVSTYSAASYAHANIGSRLCFLGA
jgi:hypothetical protein